MSEQAQAAQQQQEPVQISLQDIATVVQMIDVVSRRGGIEGNETVSYTHLTLPTILLV